MLWLAIDDTLPEKEKLCKRRARVFWDELVRMKHIDGPGKDHVDFLYSHYRHFIEEKLLEMMRDDECRLPCCWRYGFSNKITSEDQSGGKDNNDDTLPEGQSGALRTSTFEGRCMPNSKLWGACCCCNCCRNNCKWCDPFWFRKNHRHGCPTLTAMFATLVISLVTFTLASRVYYSRLGNK